MVTDAPKRRWYQFSLKTLLLFGLFLGGVTLYDYGCMIIADGRYYLTVEIDAESAANVSRISYLAVDRSDAADAVVASIDNQLRFMEHQDSTDPFTVRVSISDRVSGLGRTLRHVQEFSHVIVVLHREDGSRVVHRLAVPHSDDSRRIVVTAASAI